MNSVGPLCLVMWQSGMNTLMACGGACALLFRWSPSLWKGCVALLGSEMKQPQWTSCAPSPSACCTSGSQGASGRSRKGSERGSIDMSKRFLSLSLNLSDGSGAEVSAHGLPLLLPSALLRLQCAADSTNPVCSSTSVSPRCLTLNMTAAKVSITRVAASSTMAGVRPPGTWQTPRAYSRCRRDTLDGEEAQAATRRSMEAARAAPALCETAAQRSVSHRVLCSAQLRCCGCKERSC